LVIEGEELPIGEGKQRDVPEAGRLLQGLAFAHAAVGAAFYRSELRSIARDGVVAAVPNRGGKATAFWFLIPSPLVWIAGRLLSAAEEAGDVSAQRTAHHVGAASALAAIACMPVSGFWGWLIISLRGLRKLRGMSS
jgi:hypothetical protein